jgi:hypothetical protein
MLRHSVDQGIIQVFMLLVIHGIVEFMVFIIGHQLFMVDDIVGQHGFMVLLLMVEFIIGHQLFMLEFIMGHDGVVFGKQGKPSLHGIMVVGGQGMLQAAAAILLAIMVG